MRLPSTGSLVTTLAFAAGLATLAIAPASSAEERCYGVAPAAGNDGIDDREAPGTSTVDFQGNAWIAVPDGSCLTRPVPVQPDGTPRRGSLEPLDRDRP
jgi:uncharacterized membrane protein